MLVPLSLISMVAALAKAQDPLSDEIRGGVYNSIAMGCSNLAAINRMGFPLPMANLPYMPFMPVMPFQIPTMSYNERFQINSADNNTYSKLADVEENG